MRRRGSEEKKSDSSSAAGTCTEPSEPRLRGCVTPSVGHAALAGFNVDAGTPCPGLQDVHVQVEHFVKTVIPIKVLYGLWTFFLCKIT